MQRELIDKYFSNECTDEEREQVLEYFRNHPEEWNKYATEEDWDNFTTDEKLAPGLSEELFKNVSRQTFKRKRTMTPWLAAAGFILLVMVSLWGYFSGKKDYIVKTEDSRSQQQLTERKNLSDTLMHITLDDGSVAVLSPHSSIRYHDPFIRTVYLSGKALFEVGTNKGKPFMVYSDQLATTVLGTSFTVESFTESNLIKVKLHKGKVQVTAEEWKKKELLQPGDELIYDKGTMLANIKRSTAAEQMVKAGPARKSEHTVRRPDIYTFDISPLSEVFDQLSNYYQVDIYYYPSDIDNKYFSGRMHNNDKLETILHDIAVLNHLIVEKKENQYIIRKKN